MAVEGDLDEAIARRIVSSVGGEMGPVFGRRGRQSVISSLAGYNAAAARAAWLVLLDLDHEPCPVTFAERVLPSPSLGMCRRIVVREAEAWILADHTAFAKWAGLSMASMPTDVESLRDPKEALVQLVRRGGRTSLTRDIVPRERSGRTVGAGYNARLREFVESRWDLGRARPNSESLRRAADCVQELLQRGLP